MAFDSLNTSLTEVCSLLRLHPLNKVHKKTYAKEKIQENVQKKIELVFVLKHQ